VSNLSTVIEETTTAGHEPVEVRTDARVAAGVGGIAAIVAIAYLARVVGDSGLLDWAMLLVTGAIAAAHLQSLLDARVPLLVVDEHGVRLRTSGGSWLGLPWGDIERLEHEPRHGVLRDGRVVLVPRDGDERSVRLSLSTRVVGADGDLTAALERLAGEPDRVVEIGAVDWDDDHDGHHDEWDQAYDEHDEYDEPAHPMLPDPRPTLARGIGFLADRLPWRARTEGQIDEHDEHDEHDETSVHHQVDEEPEPTQALPLVASATPVPLRDPVTGTRTEVRFEGAAALAYDAAGTETPTDLPEAGELRRGEEPLLTGDPEPLLEPVAEPIVGSELSAARARLGLSVDQLAERTRIRPHVIESIEVDDFAPCGGDFYARGHLRTLARVLGVDAAPLLASYDEQYADAPIDARRVFEAELATGHDGPIRSTRGGPNWSVLVAAVMAIVLAWSIARLVMDSPIQLEDRPVLNGSPSSTNKLGPAVPVVLDASSGGAHVVVHDGAGQVVFNGDLAFGDTQTVKAAPPVLVQSSDGGLGVTIDGADQGPLGAVGQPASNTFAAPKE
jgi:hypothetical protein